MEKPATIRHPPPMDPDTADGEALSRERREAQATRGVVQAQAVADALDVLDAAVHQVGVRSLPTLAERLGRCYSLAMARLHREERAAVRARLAGEGQ